MKKEILWTSILLVVISVMAGLICTPNFYCNPRLTFPLFFIIIVASAYFGSYYLQSRSKKAEKISMMFIMPITILLVAFVFVALGYLITINKHDSFIEFFQYNGSLLYILNVFLLSVCLLSVTYLISSNNKYRSIFSIIISVFICGILVFLFFKNASLLNDIIISPIVIISELIIAIIGASLVLFKD